MISLEIVKLEVSSEHTTTPSGQKSQKQTIILGFTSATLAEGIKATIILSVREVQFCQLALFQQHG